MVNISPSACLLVGMAWSSLPLQNPPENNSHLGRFLYFQTLGVSSTDQSIIRIRLPGSQRSQQYQERKNMISSVIRRLNSSGAHWMVRVNTEIRKIRNAMWFTEPITRFVWVWEWFLVSLDLKINKINNKCYFSQPLFSLMSCVPHTRKELSAIHSKWLVSNNSASSSSCPLLRWTSLAFGSRIEILAGNIYDQFPTILTSERSLTSYCWMGWNELTVFCRIINDSNSAADILLDAVGRWTTEAHRPGA